MYALLALCYVLAPTRLDDNVMNIVRERYGDQIGRMCRGYVSDTSIQVRSLNALKKII
jgi:translation initiation factor 3 subunit L